MSIDKIEIQNHGLSGEFQPRRVIPRNNRGGVKWHALRDNPELLQATIESEARIVLSEVGSLMATALQRAGHHNLLGAVYRYYPGRLSALSQKVGLANNRHSPSFWESPEAIDYIRTETTRIFQEQGKLSVTVLREAGRSDLVHGIRKFYPGKFPQLYEDLGAPQNHKPEGFWSPEQVRTEVMEFYGQHGQITHQFLIDNGRSDITNAIKRYPGKWRQLRQDLGLGRVRNPNGYWTVENVEKEATNFFAQFGVLNHEALIQAGKSSLGVMITRLFPGGIEGIRQRLGIGSEQEGKISSDEANEQLQRLLEETNGN